MANFTAAVTAGATTLKVWDDFPRLPATIDADDKGAARRVNPNVQPHRYHSGVVGTEVELTATVGGVSGPADGTLGGKLFTGSFSDWPRRGVGGQPAVSSPAGFTSIQRFTPNDVGLHIFKLRRAGGGAFHIHVLVES